MANNYFNTSLFFLLSTALFGYADQPSAEAKQIQQKKEPDFIQYHNRVMLFSPMHIGYERIKPNAFYVGVEAFEAIGLKKHDENLIDVELRMGYNFFYNGRDHLTPFAGIGCVGANHTHSSWVIDYKFRDWGIVYGALGFLYTHEFNTIFNLGVNAKMLVGGPFDEKHRKWGSPVLGADIALPITFRFGNRRHWDFRLEPFYLYLHGPDSSQGCVGFRNSLGYRF